jgi:outer membrane protein assembly factor BamB
VAINADGHYSAGGTFGEKPEVHYLNQEGKVLWKTSLYGCPAVSSNGKDIAVGASDFKVYFFNLDGNLLWSFATKNTLCDMVSLSKKIAISSDGHYITAGSDKIYFLNRDGKLVWNFDTGAIINSVSMSSDGKYIVAGSDDKKVYSFNRDGSLLWVYETKDSVKSVVMSSDGKYIAAGSSDRMLYYFIQEISPGLPVQSVTTTPLANESIPKPTEKAAPQTILISVISIMMAAVVIFLSKK